MLMVLSARGRIRQHVCDSMPNHYIALLTTVIVRMTFLYEAFIQMSNIQSELIIQQQEPRHQYAQNIFKTFPR